MGVEGVRHIIQILILEGVHHVTSELCPRTQRVREACLDYVDEYINHRLIVVGV